MAKSTAPNMWLGSKYNIKQMKLGIPSGKATTDGGMIFLEKGAATGGDGGVWLFTDGTSVRYLAGSTAPTDTASSGDALGAATGATVTLNNLTTVAANASISPNSAGDHDLGTDALPWGVAYLGTSLVFDKTTRNLTITASEPGTLARTVNFGDPGANDSVAYLAATQDLTNKTYNGLTLACASVNQMVFTRGTSTITLTEGNTDILLMAGAQIDIAAAKTLHLDTDLTVNTVAVTLNQALATTSSPTFVTITGTTLTDGTATLTAGALTCRGIINTTSVIDSTVAIQIGADNVNLTFGVDDATDSKIYFSGSHLTFQDSTGGPYTLQQLATGTTLSPTVIGDLSIADGKFTWIDAADEVAGLWTIAATTVDAIDIVSSNTTGNVIHVTANATSSGNLLNLTSVDATMTSGAYIYCYDGAAQDFAVRRYGATTIAGSAAKTAALTLTTGDVVITNGQITVASTGDTVNKIARNNGTGTGPVLEIEDTHIDGGVTLLVDSKNTGFDDALQITHAGYGYGLKVTGTFVEGTQAIFTGPASQIVPSVEIDGTTGAWIGAATTGMLHLKSDGALANASASLIYSTYTGAVGATQVLGTCAQFADAGAAGTNTWALGVSSTNNSGVYIATSATGMTGLKVSGPVGQTVPIVSIDGTATTGWVGAASTGMLHIAVDGATANATASALQIVIGTGTPTTASTGFAFKIADTTGVAANPDTTYAAYIGTLTNSGLSIVTAGTTARNLVLSGVQSQTAAMVALDGTTGTGWIGAATTGMLDLSCDGATAATTTSVLQIRTGAGTPANTAGGYAVRIADTTAAAAAALTTYAVYISAANNEALKVDDGFSVFDEGIATKVAVTDVANPPTNANMITAFGAVAGVPAGFVGLLDDAGTGTKLYLCAMVNGKYWQVEMTAGV